MAFISGSTQDPIARFGQQAANHILSGIRNVAPSARPAALRALFKSLDPGLNRRVDKVSARLVRKGMTPQAAVRAALAMSLSQGLLEEYKTLGYGNQLRARSIAALATRNGRQVALGAYAQALGWSIGGAISTVTGGASDVVTAITKPIGKGATDAKAGAIKYGGKAISAIGDLACSVATSGAGQAGAAIAGGPAAAHGAQVAASMCKGTPMPPPPKYPLVPPPEPGPPKWLLIAAAGGAALAVVLAIR